MSFIDSVKDTVKSVMPEKKEEFDYFDCFAKMMRYADEAGDMLYDLLVNFDPEKLEENSRRLHETEQLADLCKHQLMEVLLKEFLPPFDREDIIELSHRLDDITDCIDEVSLDLYMFNIRQCRQEALVFANVLCSCCTELRLLFEGFSKYKRNGDELRGHIVKVNTIESEGDRAYLSAIRTLYTDGTDTKLVCAWTEIFARLENCCDACEKCADIVEEIILKNS